MATSEQSDPTLITVPIRPDEVPQDLICAICLSVPLNPWVVRRCSHVFCKDCIARCIEPRKECPVCRCDIYKCGWIETKRQFLPLQPLISESPLLHRIWSRIEVRCQNYEEGCCWTGAIADYKAHSGSRRCSASEKKADKNNAESKPHRNQKRLEEEIEKHKADLRRLRGEYQKKILKLTEATAKHKLERTKPETSETQNQTSDNSVVTCRETAEITVARSKRWRRRRPTWESHHLPEPGEQKRPEDRKTSGRLNFRSFFHRYTIMDSLGQHRVRPGNDVPISRHRSRE